MKTVCIYHSVDLDGWMSAAIVKHWFITNFCGLDEQDGHPISDDSLCMMGYNYGQPVPNLSEYDKIIMCDISFPKEIMLQLYNNYKEDFIWLDHHISAINDVASIHIEEKHKSLINLIAGLRGKEYSACEITWIYFFLNKDMPEIVRLLGRYDCFGHKGTDEEQKVSEFQYGARSVISNYEEAYNWLQDGILHSLTTINRIHKFGIAIYQYLCTEAKQVYKNGFCVEFLITDCYEGTPIPMGSHRVKFICINKERFNPINFGINYHEDGYDGCVCFYFDGKNYNFSLYNDNGEVDCSVIAKQYGGGGHAGASGFILTKEQFMELIK